MSLNKTEKLCIYCFVANERYYHYIPLFVYFSIRAYPEAFVLVQCKSEVPKEILSQVEKIKGNFIIEENVFKDYPNDIDVVKTLRWISLPKYFLYYDYVLITDIDIMHIKEYPDLVERHLSICFREGLPFSNTSGLDPVETRGYRMTGIHFVKTREYLREIIPVADKYSKILKIPGGINVFYNDKLKKNDNQMALRVMLEEAGYRIPTHNSFEYGGFHLGDSREPGRWEERLKSPEWQARLKVFIEVFNQMKSDGIYSEDIPIAIHNEFKVLVDLAKEYK